MGLNTIMKYYLDFLCTLPVHNFYFYRHFCDVRGYQFDPYINEYNDLSLRWGLWVSKKSAFNNLEYVLCTHWQESVEVCKTQYLLRLLLRHSCFNKYCTYCFPVTAVPLALSSSSRSHLHWPPEMSSSSYSPDPGIQGELQLPTYGPAWFYSSDSQ